MVWFWLAGAVVMGGLCWYWMLRVRSQADWRVEGCEHQTMVLVCKRCHERLEPSSWMTVEIDRRGRRPRLVISCSHCGNVVSRV